MREYSPNYPDLSKVSNKMMPLGLTSRECVEIEESTQEKVADNAEWLLAKKLNSVRGKLTRGDSREELETLGFKVLGEYDKLFYRVQHPEGWIKATHGYWTTISDDKGNEIITQFHKGAFYDRDAFLNITEQGASA